MEASLKNEEDRAIAIPSNRNQNRGFRAPVKKEFEHRINRRITAPVVRVVGDNVEPAIMHLKEALKIAEEKGLDLVEISPTANPPVCKVIDYQKFLYEQKRKQKEIKAKSAKIVVKEIRLGPQTDDHDFNFKLNHAKRFLSEGSKVKVDVVICKIPTDTVVNTVQKVLCTGKVGDGKIFVYDVEDVVKVRTNEHGYDALQDEE